MSIGKSIRVYLADSTVTGIRYAELVNWTGHALACPRNRLNELKVWPEVSKPGVYFLFEGRFSDLRSDAARALPRPSANASAKVAKSTVSQSQVETAPVNQADSLLRPARDRAKVTSVMTLAISTQNMTGLRQRMRGSSFFRESSKADRMIPS